MKLQLNFNKPGNYAFFCPVSKVHLTRSNPVGFVNEVTSYISRGLKSKSIIEIPDNNMTGQRTAKPVQKEEVKATEAMSSVEEEPATAPVEEAKEETVQVESEPVQQKAPAEPSEKPSSKRGRPKKA